MVMNIIVVNVPAWVFLIFQTLLGICFPILQTLLGIGSTLCFLVLSLLRDQTGQAGRVGYRAGRQGRDQATGRAGYRAGRQSRDLEQVSRAFHPKFPEPRIPFPLPLRFKPT